MESILSLLFSLLMLVLVLYLAYITTKWLGKRSFGNLQSHSNNMKVLDRLALSQDKTLLIVQVAGQYILLGLSGQGIEKIAQLDGAALSWPDPDQRSENDFSKVLKNSLRNPWGFGTKGQSSKGEGK